MSGVETHVVVRGVVQGVGYRAWSARTATQLGLTGWVQNCKDGSVEMVVQGEPAGVAQFVELCKRGPPKASVDSVIVSEQPVSHQFDYFAVKKGLLSE